VHRDEQLRMGFCDVEVIVEDGDRRDHVIGEPPPLRSRCASRLLNADSQFDNRDRRNCNVVIVRDRVSRRIPGTLSADEIRESRRSRVSAAPRWSLILESHRARHAKTDQLRAFAASFSRRIHG
jgi:hypothetical protein